MAAPSPDPSRRRSVQVQLPAHPPRFQLFDPGYRRAVPPPSERCPPLDQGLVSPPSTI